jgi:hypothetical protein
VLVCRGVFLCVFPVKHGRPVCAAVVVVEGGLFGRLAVCCPHPAAAAPTYVCPAMCGGGVQQVVW